jgi:membrane protein implicated in regulation of membrane protease activity
VDFGNNPWLVWLGVALVAGTIEVLTLDLIFLMIAGGAVAASVAAAFGAPLTVDLVVFAVTSGLLLLAARPPLLAYLRRSTPASVTGAAALVGAEGEVLVAVSREGGRVKLAGEVWSARSATGGLPLEVGSRVRVVRIDGATAVVAPSTSHAALGGVVPPDGPAAGQ